MPGYNALRICRRVSIQSDPGWCYTVLVQFFRHLTFKFPIMELRFDIGQVEHLVSYTKTLIEGGSPVRGGFDEPGLILAKSSCNRRFSTVPSFIVTSSFPPSLSCSSQKDRRRRIPMKMSRIASDVSMMNMTAKHAAAPSSSGRMTALPKYAYSADRIAQTAVTKNSERSRKRNEKACTP